MAHAATLKSLVGDLVTSITGLTANDKSFNNVRDKAGRSLKDQSSPATNQFHVKAAYAGLVEKFEVLDRDDLADALQSRLDELPTNGFGFLLETLSLLLQLSDKPVEKTRLEELVGSQPVEGEPLTWQAIIADDPLNNDGLWDDIERGYHSSGDERIADQDDNGENRTTSTLATSLEDEDLESLAKLHVTPIDRSSLDDVCCARRDLDQARDRSPSIFSEIILVRESLTMLHGLPTDLFHNDSKTGKIVMNNQLALSTASTSTVSAALSQYVKLGSMLNVLRIWSHTVQREAWVQSIQAAIQTQLLVFNRQLSTTETAYLRVSPKKIVSLMEVYAKVEVAARPLLHLSATVQRCISGTALKVAPKPYALLDALYEEACLTQLGGDHRTFEILTTVLHAGVQTYLTPVSGWLRHGVLPLLDRETFLVQELEADCAPADMWYRRYRLRPLSDGAWAAPSFMQPFVEEVFAMGKTKAFLRLLSQTDGQATDDDPDRSNAIKLSVGCAGCDGESAQDSLLPYPQDLAEQLGAWVSRSVVDFTPILRSRMLLDHGLGDALKALEYVYFAKDGHLFETFAHSLSTRIRLSQQNGGSWENSFILSELAHNTLGNSAFVDANSMLVRCLNWDHNNPARSTSSATQAIGTVMLEYRLSWPFQTITREQSSSVHPRALAFLFQIYCAKSRLTAQLLKFRPLSNRSTIAIALMLRQRLLWFLDIIHNHITSRSSVLHSLMTAQMATADGIDSMTSIWAGYIKHLEMSLVLASKLAPIHNSILKILELCEQFADLWTLLVSATDFDVGTSDEVARRQNVQTAKLLREQFDNSVYFITAGLRGIGRAGGDAALEILAQRLDLKAG